MSFLGGGFFDKTGMTSARIDTDANEKSSPPAWLE